MDKILEIILVIMSFKLKLAAGVVASIALLGTKGAIADSNIPDAGRISQ